MPSILYDIRLMMTVAALSAALATGGCGGKEEAGGSTAEMQMKGLETVDGTVNDAMTDLDGVQSEGTAMADTGTGGNAAVAAPAQDVDKSADANAASDAATEVVADQ